LVLRLLLVVHLPALRVLRPSLQNSLGLLPKKTSLKTSLKKYQKPKKKKKGHESNELLLSSQVWEELECLVHHSAHHCNLVSGGKRVRRLLQ
jgi:hypothetical protein